MASNVFGKDISRVFFPLEDNEPLNLPSQVPALYLYETRPNYTDAAAGTGALQSLTYWTHDENTPFPRSFTWNAVDDPSPSTQAQAKTYYEAINFRTQASEQIQTLVRSLTLERVQELDSVPGTSIQDLKDAYPGISNYLTDAQLEEILEDALEEFKIDLEGKGIEYHKVYDLRKSRLALAYKAISLSMLSQIRERDDKHNFRYEEYKEKYTAIMNLITIPIDTDSDGEPDAIADTDFGVVINYR